MRAIVDAQMFDRNAGRKMGMHNGVPELRTGNCGHTEAFLSFWQGIVDAQLLARAVDKELWMHNDEP